MKKLNLALMVGLLILAGCSNDEFNKYKGNEGVKTITSLTATLNEKADTRLHIIDGWEGGDKLLGWQYGDRIEVYSDLDADTRIYDVTNIAEGETVAYFVGDEVTGNTFYAFFPEGSTRTAYEMINVDEENPLLLRVNYDNSYTAYPFTDEDFFTYAPMVAISDGDGFAFKQTTGMVHFCVTGIDNIGRVIFKGNNGEPLLGNGYIDLSQDEPQLVIEQGETDMEVWGVTADQDDIHVYFCIPPTTFTKGITLEIWPEDDEYADNHIIKTLSEPMTIGRAEVKTFPTIDVNAELQNGHVDMDSQKEALLNIFEVLGTEHPETWTNWNTEASINEWAGVTVDSNGNVTELNFEDTGIIASGAMPAAIAQLKHLQYVNLCGTGITSLPEEFCDLTEVWGIRAGYAFESLPESLGKLINLETIVIEFSQITHIPESIGNLQKLRVLNIRDSKITNFPEGMGNLHQLRYLFLGNNNIEGELPASFFNDEMVNLITLDLSMNRLTGIITNTMQQTQTYSHPNSILLNPQQEGYGLVIEAIEIDSQRTILSEFYQSTVGDQWTFNNNWNTNVPFSNNGWYGIIAENENVTEINLSGNGLSGTIPESIGLMPYLTKIDVSNNNLQGDINEVLSNILKNKKGWISINLSNNRLTGTIRKEVQEHLKNIAHVIINPQINNLGLEVNVFYEDGDEDSTYSRHNSYYNGGSW